MNDSFKPANIKCKPNSRDIYKASYLEGVATRNIKAREELDNNYGEDYWTRNSNFEEIADRDRKLCMKFYDFDKEDIVVE